MLHMFGLYNVLVFCVPYGRLSVYHRMHERVYNSLRTERQGMASNVPSHKNILIKYLYMEETPMQLHATTTCLCKTSITSCHMRLHHASSKLSDFLAVQFKSPASF